MNKASHQKLPYTMKIYLKLENYQIFHITGKQLIQEFSYGIHYYFSLEKNTLKRIYVSYDCYLLDFIFKYCKT